LKIRKAIIPAAGLGTRFLPATKAQPKEMLPIVDKPTIQYIVEEAVASGIEDIIIISGRGKRSIEDHFDTSFELEETLAKRGKQDLLEQVQNISNMANIHYIRQKEPKGLGDAIYCANRFIGDEPFAVLLGDDIVRSNIPCLKQMIDIFDVHQSSVLGVKTVQDSEVHKYGIVEPLGAVLEDGSMNIQSLVEKPTIDRAPSNYAIAGRYILTPDIFDLLAKTEPDASGEIQLTSALQALNKQSTILAYPFHGERYDVGDKMGFLRATLDFALERKEIHSELLNYMETMVELSKRYQS
jgi:UTP--glucose-1-phosphate uridylyltransferase